MKMSKKTFETFKKFYDFTVETATDENIFFILNAVKTATSMKLNKNMNEHNARVIRDFFENFLATANDDDAIYLIEVIKSACDKIVKDPENVAKFVVMKKKEAAKNGKKD